MVLRALLAAALAALLPSAAQAAVVETMTVNYYTASVGDQPLGTALVAANPVRGGEHAHTEWKIDWRFDTVPTSGNKCQVSSVTTNLSITMTLPQITDASTEAQAKFDAYLPKLREHEDGHADIARQAAANIDSTIASTANLPCSTIISLANDAANRIVDALDAEEQDYDARTGHGREQGAWLE